MRAVWTIARRELRALFDQPIAYILLVVFLAINDFLFFRQAYLVRVASLRPMLDILPWILLFFVPAVTMRALAEDLRTGTLEVVLAQPVTELEVLLGKYLGQLVFVCVAVALTFPIPMGLALGADLQMGVIVAQYVGTVLLAAGLTAIGLWASSATRHQITAFMTGVAVMFPLILVGLNPLIVGLPPALATIAANLGVLSHFENIGRGVIDLRDAVYFLTLAAAFLTFAYLAIMQRRLSPQGAMLKRLRLGTGLLTAGFVVVNLFGQHIAGRLDLTPGKAYTLSPYTKQLLGGLGDFVTFKVFVSEQLPPEVSLVKRDIMDLLGDFRAAGRGQVRVVVRDPDDPGAKEEARDLGIPPVQFNVIGESELSVKEGYLGIVVQYANDAERIPFVQRTDDLEYRLTSFVRSLTRTERPVVGMLQQGLDPSSDGTYQSLRAELEQNYQVRNLSLSDSSAIPDSIRAVVLIGPASSLSDAQVRRFTDYLRWGGGALIMTSGMARQGQGFMAEPLPVGWNRVLEPYRVSIRPDMVYDLASNERVQVPASGGRFQLVVPYPFWIRALSSRRSAMNQDIDAVLLPWASSIDTTEAATGSVTPLFVTSRAGGAETGRALITPQRDFPQDSLKIKLVAAMVNPLAADSASQLHGRVVVVGNADFATDRFAQNAPAGLLFALNAVDWLAQDAALIAIRSKDRNPPPLVFESGVARDGAKYGNLVGIPLLLIALATVRLWRRRRLSGRPYQPEASAEAA